MNAQLFQLVHLSAVLLLSGVTFAAFAAPHPDNRRSYLMMSGILSLLVVLSGGGTLGMAGLGFPVWAWVKVVCWLVLSGLTGMAFRMTGQIRMLTTVAVVAILTAVVMATYRPF